MKLGTLAAVGPVAVDEYRPPKNQESVQHRQQLLGMGGKKDAKSSEHEPTGIYMHVNELEKRGTTWGLQRRTLIVGDSSRLCC